MNLKKIALAGAVVLVVLGCILAAGCTSTSTYTNTTTTNGVTTTTTTTTVNGQTSTVTFNTDDLAGNWTVKDTVDGIEDCSITFVINKDGTGNRYVYLPDGSIGQDIPITWAPSEKGMDIDIEIDEGIGVIHFTISPDKKTITDGFGDSWTKE